MHVSYKPQKISPKFSGTVVQLLHTKIRDSYVHPQFQTDVIKPLQVDKLFDQEAVNLDAEEAVEMAGEDCNVVSLGQQLDLCGTYGEELLAGWLNELSSRKNRSWHLFCASEKTILFFVDSNGEVYFVDSHLKTSKKSD